MVLKFSWKTSPRHKGESLFIITTVNVLYINKQLPKQGTGLGDRDSNKAWQVVVSRDNALWTTRLGFQRKNFFSRIMAQIDSFFHAKSRVNQLV